MPDDNLDRSFLGKGWSFPPSFDRDNKVIALRTVSLDEDIRESLRILLETNPGERVMQPTYGCGLKRMVFESIDETVVTEMKDLIERAILFFEPRITLNSINIEVDDAHIGILRIYLDYTIRTINTRSNLVYPFYLNEGR